MTNKNQKIKEALHARLELQVKHHSLTNFKDYILSKLDQVEKSTYSSDEWKKNDIEDLKYIINNSSLNQEIESLRENRKIPESKEFQQNIENQLIQNFNKIAEEVHKSTEPYELNLLFLEFDQEREGVFYGFDDDNYKYQLLTGQEYMDFDPTKWLFEGLGSFDSSQLMVPVWNIEENIDVEIGHDFIEEYLNSIRELSLSNIFYGIHLCMERIGHEFLQLNIPVKDEVFFFGNEHDCEQQIIYNLIKN